MSLTVQGQTLGDNKAGQEAPETPGGGGAKGEEHPATPDPAPLPFLERRQGPGERNAGHYFPSKHQYVFARKMTCCNGTEIPVPTLPQGNPGAGSGSTPAPAPFAVSKELASIFTWRAM